MTKLFFYNNYILFNITKLTLRYFLELGAPEVRKGEDSAVKQYGKGCVGEDAHAAVFVRRGSS